MGLSEIRRNELLRLVNEGGDELTEAIARGQQDADQHLAKMRKEITDFLQSCTDKDELDFFAANWSRDGREWPIHELVKNPYVDAGTLLRVFWYSDPEYYYESCGSAAEVDEDYEREVFVTLEEIERRLTPSALKSATIPFDPGNYITMWDERSELARPIPEVMYQPITGQPSD